jgi:hypothetical protein
MFQACRLCYFLLFVYVNESDVLIHCICCHQASVLVILSGNLIDRQLETRLSYIPYVCLTDTTLSLCKMSPSSLRIRMVLTESKLQRVH